MSQIKVGQIWKQRDGKNVKIMGYYPESKLPWITELAALDVHGYHHLTLGSPDNDLIHCLKNDDGSLTLVGRLADQATASEPGLATNPKDAIGSTKLPLHLWPAEATALGCLGMLEGKEKYGRNNYIAGDGVVASIYLDAVKRHLDAWFSGEEVSPDTQNDHIGNALACLAILAKARAHGKLIDDRDFSPNPGYRELVEKLTPNVKRLQALFADRSPRDFTIGDNPSAP